MKRNMNLVRLLLLDREGAEPKPDLSAFTEEEVVYHTALLIEAGLIHGLVIENNQGALSSTVAFRLTWAGHEFLDAARNETIWKHATERIRKAGVDVSLSLLGDLLKSLLKEPLGLK